MSVLSVMLFPTSAGGVYLTGAYFGRGTGIIHLDEVRCSGSESSLLSCPHSGIDVINFCNHAEDAGVRCSVNSNDN